jgi:uncharacterized membrane protein
MNRDESMRDREPAEHRFGATTFLLTGGLLIWMANFMFVYVFAALACARGFATMHFFGIGIVPLITTLASIAASVATGLLCRSSIRKRAGQGEDEHGAFIRFVTYATCLLAFVALVWIALPSLVVDACRS